MWTIVALACHGFIKHASTGKFLPDDFNVTEIEERTKWEETRPYIKCGVCQLVVTHAYERLDIATADEEALHTFLEGVCEVSDAELFHRYQIVADGKGSWDVELAHKPDDRRVDIRKWHSLSMRDTCAFVVPPNDDLIVKALRLCRDEARRVECVCSSTPVCQRSRSRGGAHPPVPDSNGARAGAKHQAASVGKDEI